MFSCTRWSATSIRQGIRTFAVSIDSPVVYPRKAEPRKFNPRKTHLFNYYATLLRSSTSSPLLLLDHKHFSVPALIKLRKDIAAASLKHQQDADSQVKGVTTVTELTIIRSSIFGVALRSQDALDVETQSQIAEMVNGGLAILRLASLHPPELCSPPSVAFHGHMMPSRCPSCSCASFVFATTPLSWLFESKSTW